MRIGVLTGGGDVPGLNPCIKAIVNRAVVEGHEVLGIRRGWAGLLEYNPDDERAHEKNMIPLDKKRVRTIDRTGGTILHTSRTNPAQVQKSAIPDFLQDFEAPPAAKEGAFDFTAHVLRILEHLGIEALLPIGGDDTLGYAARLHTEGFPVISIPKTMDNDVFGTDYCIGFSTAVSRSVGLITNLRTPTGSHERLGVIELFGRQSGETSLVSAYLADADRAIIAEVPFDLEKLAQFLEEDAASNPSNYAMMTISEGAKLVGEGIVDKGDKADAFGHKKLGGIGEIVREELKKRTGRGVVYQQLAYLMRSGAPDSLDRMVAVSYGSLAMELLLSGERGRMVALKEGKYTHVPADTVSQGVKRVDVDELYDTDTYRPKIVRVLDKPMFLY
jgi:6-phosphofructokinase